MLASRVLGTGGGDSSVHPSLPSCRLAPLLTPRGGNCYLVSVCSDFLYLHTCSWAWSSFLCRFHGGRSGINKGKVGGEGTHFSHEQKGMKMSAKVHLIYPDQDFFLKVLIKNKQINKKTKQKTSHHMLQ